jgi:hypothetical protein
MRQEAARWFFDVLYDELGGEVNAAAAHAEYLRLHAKYWPLSVPSDADPRERDAVTRWESASAAAHEAAFSRWPNLNQGTSVAVHFLPTYRVRVRRELIAGLAQDGARRNILCGEYVVEHDASVLLFRAADTRGGDITVDLADSIELAGFPNELAETQLEVIKRIY